MADKQLRLRFIVCPCCGEAMVTFGLHESAAEIHCSVCSMLLKIPEALSKQSAALDVDPLPDVRILSQTSHA